MLNSAPNRNHLHLLSITALFAGAITVMTAYMLHIPIPTGGYIHLGDALIYLAACLLPLPYAAAAAAIGAGLADLLTAPMWVLPTLVIKALLASFFTSGHQRILCPPECGRRGAGRGLLSRRLRPGRLCHGRDPDRLCPPVPGDPGPGHRKRGALFRPRPRPGRGKAQDPYGDMIGGNEI